VAGPALFLLTMALMFQLVFAWAEPLIAAVEALVAATGIALRAHLPAGPVGSFLVDGLLAGVGNVLVFLPQIALLFAALGLLEGSGYLARAAALSDRWMRRIGLQGKSFVPLLGCFACAIPGMMAARTVGSTRERLVTLFIAPFMSCSARLPVYVLVISALFAGRPMLGGLLMTGMYALGFAAAVVTAWLLKGTVLRATPLPFVLELPPYQWPDLREVGRSVLRRCGIFVRQTGRLIVVLSLALWVLLTFPQGPIEDTAAGRIGHAIEPAIAPLGFDWRIGIGLIASFAAREVLVTTLAQVYAIQSDDEDAGLLRAALRADGTFTPWVGLSLMVFFVLALQCMSTVAVMRRETGGWRWPLAQLLYMNAFAYAASLLVYQLGSRLSGG
jgi:ferrous iron transport protein B